MLYSVLKRKERKRKGKKGIKSYYCLVTITTMNIDKFCSVFSDWKYQNIKYKVKIFNICILFCWKLFAHWLYQTFMHIYTWNVCTYISTYIYSITYIIWYILRYIIYYIYIYIYIYIYLYKNAYCCCNVKGFLMVCLCLYLD